MVPLADCPTSRPCGDGEDAAALSEVFFYWIAAFIALLILLAVIAFIVVRVVRARRR